MPPADKPDSRLFRSTPAADVAASLPADERLRDREAQAIMNTYNRLPIVIVDGEGCVVRDGHGREYLDFLAGIAVSNLGHRHSALVRAVQRAAEGVWHTSNLYYTEPQVALAERLCGAAGMERAFFCNSGAEAVEAALKLARKHGSSTGGADKVEILAASGSFHGRTFGAVTATGQPNYSAPFRPTLPGISHVPFGDADALARAMDARTAAVLLEVVQGEGGIRPVPDGYLEAARELCDEHEALLILDEVQTGFGRTGTLFAFQQTAIVPDAICFAKAIANGLPMGALMARDAAATALQRGEHASTFGGGPLVSAVALAVLDELQRPGLLVEVLRMGQVAKDELTALAAQHGARVRAVRGRGLMWGVELAEPVARRIVEAALAEGLLIGAAGPRVVRLTPPLIVSEQQLREGLDRLAAAFTAGLSE